MITGFLLAYATFTLPLFGWALWRVRKQKKPVVKKADTLLDFQEIIKKAFSDKGIEAKMVEIPEFDVGITRVDLAKAEQIIVAWLTSLRDKADVNKRDMDAMLQASKAMATSILDIQKTLEQPAQKQKNQNAFINDLRYVGERFAKTATEKKAIESIISHIRQTHGAE